MIPRGFPPRSPAHARAVSKPPLTTLRSFEPRAVLGQVRLNYCTKLWYPGYIFEPAEQFEFEPRFRHVPGRFILIRKDQLNRPDKVRRVKPTVNFLAQPIKPTPGNFGEQIVRFGRSLPVYQWTTPARMTNVDGQLELSRVMSEPPDRGEKIMRTLEGSVIECLDGSPVRMIRVVQQGTGTECEQVARPDDDAERIAVYIVLLPRHLLVIITVKAGNDPHRESPDECLPLLGTSAQISGRRQCRASRAVASSESVS